METKKSLEDKASTLKVFISSKEINAPTCPFCGRKQEKYDIRIDPPIYRPCNCEGMQKFMNAKKQLAELDNSIENISNEIEMCSISAARSLDNCHLGERFRDCSFDNFAKDCDETAYLAALNFAKNFPENDGSGLILVGSAGTGKTHLAAAISNYLVKDLYVPVCFWNYSEALDHIRKSFRDTSINSEDVIQKMVDAPLLILDDLGKEKRSEWSDEQMYRIINNRYIDKKPIVITSNFDLEHLLEMLDQSIISRLFGTCRAVKMNGNDYRLRKYLPS